MPVSSEPRPCQNSSGLEDHDYQDRHARESREEHTRERSEMYTPHEQLQREEAVIMMPAGQRITTVPESNAHRKRAENFLAAGRQDGQIR